MSEHDSSYEIAFIEHIEIFLKADYVKLLNVR